MNNKSRKVALVYDADYTLLNEYHPNAVLRRRGVVIDEFWKKVGETQKQEVENGEMTGLDIIYLAHFMNEVRNGKLGGLTLSEIRSAGADVDATLYPGLPEFFGAIKNEFPDTGISHNIVSVGIKPVLEGSCLADHMDYIYGYTFFDTLSEGDQIDEVKSTTSSREKIPSLVGISYGNPDVDGFEYPISNMIYFGDGETDRPAFRFVKKRGGVVICVYDEHKKGAREKAEKLSDDAHHLLPADYSVGGPIWSVVRSEISKMS